MRAPPLCTIYAAFRATTVATSLLLRHRWSKQFSSKVAFSCPNSPGVTKRPALFALSGEPGRQMWRIPPLTRDRSRHPRHLSRAQPLARMQNFPRHLPAWPSRPYERLPHAIPRTSLPIAAILSRDTSALVKEKSDAVTKTMAHPRPPGARRGRAVRAGDPGYAAPPRRCDRAQGSAAMRRALHSCAG